MQRQGLEVVRDADCLDVGCPKEMELMLIQRRDSLYLKKGVKTFPQSSGRDPGRLGQRAGYKEPSIRNGGHMVV